VAAQAVHDLNTMISPFLPHGANRVDTLFGGAGRVAPLPRIEEVKEVDVDVAGADATDGDGSAYPIITGDYRDEPRWGSRPVPVGATVGKPVPPFTKLDSAVVDEELGRLAREADAS
jgi:methionyl-tRNA synthetase